MKSLIDPTDRDEIRRRVAALRPDSQRQWGVMNVEQMMCHLADSFRLAMGLRPATSVANPISRTVMKWGAVYFPMRWPKGFRTRPEVEVQGRDSAN